MLSSGTVLAQVPAPVVGLSAAQLDQAAADALKEVHNRGADLYNRGDPAAAYRMYEGALSATGVISSLPDAPQMPVPPQKHLPLTDRR